MKRLLVLAMSLGLVAAMAVPALAGGAADKATGSFVYKDVKIVSFNAHEEMDNRPVKGNLWISPNAIDFYTVDIEWADIDPDAGTACFGGTISAEGFYAERDGKTQAFYAKDNGEPGAGEDLFRAYGTNTTTCPPDLDPQMVLTGNLQVHAGSAYK